LIPEALISFVMNVGLSVQLCLWESRCMYVKWTVMSGKTSKAVKTKPGLNAPNSDVLLLSVNWKTSRTISSYVV
jgi:hypothetical protein